MSRVFVNPQGGRKGKIGIKKEEEWGTTTSQSEFRGYEAAEMRNARDAPRHTREALQTFHSGDKGTQPKGNVAPGTYIWHRSKEDFPDQSAYTATVQSGSLPKLSQGGGSQGSKPAWAKTHANPIPEKKFSATSSYNQHQIEAQQARHGHFPYRDEFAPRSKRLLYELALHKASCDSVASGSTDSASAFTMSSRHSAARSGVARSCSEGSLVSSHHTADSDRVVGGIARRRAQAQFRAPNQWAADAKWFQETYDREGPQGLSTGNFKPCYYDRSCKQHVEQTIAIQPLLGGQHEHEVLGK